MEYKERKKRYEAIEGYRDCPLIVFATSTRPGASGQIQDDCIRVFIDQIERIKSSDKVDVLVHSAGGDALVSWRLMSLLRARFETVSVLVPFEAMSAATMFALGADEIVMHPYASLGPIDPQLRVNVDGRVQNFAYEDVSAFLRFVSEDAGVSDQKYVSSVVDRLFSSAEPLLIGAARRASDLSSSIGTRLLRMHMTEAEDYRQAEEIAKDLNRSFFHHGDTVSRSQAKKLKLKIAADDAALEKLLWDAYLGLESSMQLREVFSIKKVARHAERVLGESTAKFRLPADFEALPQEQQDSKIAELKMKVAVDVAKKTQYTLITGLVESVRLSTQESIVGCVVPDPHKDTVELTQQEEATGWINIEDTPPSTKTPAKSRKKKT